MKKQTDFTIADLSRALIREYLFQRGLKNTLSTFQREDIDNKKKISKNLLIDMLSIKTICLNNKQQASPQNTILQVLVAYLNKRYQARKLVFAKTEPQVFSQKNTQQSKQQFHNKQQTVQIPNDKFMKKERPNTSKPRNRPSVEVQSKPSIKFQKDELKVIYQKVAKNQNQTSNKKQEPKSMLAKDDNFRIKYNPPVEKPVPLIKTTIQPLKVQDEYEQNFEEQKEVPVQNQPSLPRIQQKLVSLPPSLPHIEGILTTNTKQASKQETKPILQTSQKKYPSLFKIQLQLQSKLVEQSQNTSNKLMKTQEKVQKQNEIDQSKKSQNNISKPEHKLSQEQSTNKFIKSPIFQLKHEEVNNRLNHNASQQKINTLPIVFSEEPQIIELKAKYSKDNTETSNKVATKANEGQQISKQQVSIKPARTLMRPSNKNKDSAKMLNEMLNQPQSHIEAVRQSKEEQKQSTAKQQAKQQQKMENKEQKKMQQKSGNGQVMVTLGKKRKNKEESNQAAYPTKFKFDQNFTHEIQKEEVYNYQPYSIDKFTLEDKFAENYPSIVFKSEINYKQKAGGLPLPKKKNQKIISSKDAQRLKTVTFQSGPAVLPKSWIQGFILSPFQSTPYGLKQIEGGPCGIIAAVQCYFLKHLLYNSKETNLQDPILRQVCLVAAITDILFKVKSDDKITLAFPPKGATKSDVNNLRINVIDANTFQTAFSGVWLNRQEYIGQKNLGVAALLFTVILTKGIENIEAEMDNKQNPLIGNHGHCTQQFVNLLLTGKATSNCFDGDKVLDDYKLKGITQKSQFGFLTIFETLKYIQVGKNLKNPVLPIWVICKQFHYHVIFGSHYLISNNNKCQKFDIVYFDGLYNCGDRIRLTLESLSTQQQDSIKVKDLPLIQQVMMTKWGVRKVNWNGSTRIL